jgi:hypothetical protein
LSFAFNDSDPGTCETERKSEFVVPNSVRASMAEPTPDDETLLILNAMNRQSRLGRRGEPLVDSLRWTSSCRHFHFRSVEWFGANAFKSVHALPPKNPLLLVLPAWSLAGLVGRWTDDSRRLRLLRVYPEHFVICNLPYTRIWPMESQEVAGSHSFKTE